MISERAPPLAASTRESVVDFRGNHPFWDTTLHENIVTMGVTFEPSHRSLSV